AADESAIQLGRARQLGNQLHVPLILRGTQALYGFDGVIEYDASRLRFLGARRARGAQGAVVAIDTHNAGILRVAIANGQPLPESPILSLHFAAAPRHNRRPSVRL